MDPMKSQYVAFLAATLMSLIASKALADCGLRRGGCSDPCAASRSHCAHCEVGYVESVRVSPTSPTPNVQGTAAVSGCSTCGVPAAIVPAMQAIVSVPETELVDCGPIESFKVVMVPDYITQTDYQAVTSYREEVRQRTRTVPRQVAVEVQDYRTKTVMVPKTETKTVSYTVLVPERKEKTVDLTETVPVWNEVTENYTVRVPIVVDVPEEYTVQVPQLRDETFTYTVYVPQAQTQMKLQTVTNAVPVTKTRTIQVSKPVTRMHTVTKDYGRWEVRMEEVAIPTTGCTALATSVYATGGCGIGSGLSGTYNGGCSECGGCEQSYTTMASGCVTSSNCGSCGGCSIPNSAALATQAVSRRVWVPNVVTEEVPVIENVMESQLVTYTAFEQQTEQIPYECTYLVYAPEQRTGTKKVVDYINETRTRNRKVVQYNEETRTRTRKELSYKQETRTQTIPYVSYRKETKTKEVSYTISVPETQVEPVIRTEYQTVQEEIVEDYTIRVPVTEYQEIKRQVCRMIPKLVPVTLYPCSPAGAHSIGSVGGCSGCESGVEYPAGKPEIPVTPTLAPVIDDSGL